MKLSFILFGCALLVFAVSGCAYQEVLRSQMLEYESTIPTCASDEECEVKWAAAKEWILRVYDWDILDSSDDIIEAYTPAYRFRYIDLRVVKQSMGNNTYKLVIYIYSDNHPTVKYPVYDEWEKKIDFNRYVNAAE
ncbi:MAG: hypothetical protein JRD68_09890 [Deltaproteobacteria bacterium]|nr:hypothetical protein [Deltaproteobacteria bacterium]